MADRILRLLSRMYTVVGEKASDYSKESRVEESASESLGSVLDHDEVCSLREQKVVIHRVDRRRVATCGLIFFFSLMDRGNLGNAPIPGLVYCDRIIFRYFLHWHNQGVVTQYWFSIRTSEIERKVHAR